MAKLEDLFKRTFTHEIDGIVYTLEFPPYTKRLKMSQKIKTEYEYDKNGNIIKDKDGNPVKTIKIDEEFADIMRDNFLAWVKSYTDETGTHPMTKEVYDTILPDWHRDELNSVIIEKQTSFREGGSGKK